MKTNNKKVMKTQKTKKIKGQKIKILDQTISSIRSIKNETDIKLNYELNKNNKYNKEKIEINKNKQLENLTKKNKYQNYLCIYDDEKDEISNLIKNLSYRNKQYSSKNNLFYTMKDDIIQTKAPNKKKSGVVGRNNHDKNLNSSENFLTGIKIKKEEKKQHFSITSKALSEKRLLRFVSQFKKEEVKKTSVENKKNKSITPDTKILTSKTIQKSSSIILKQLKKERILYFNTNKVVADKYISHTNFKLTKTKRILNFTEESKKIKCLIKSQSKKKIIKPKIEKHTKIKTRNKELVKILNNNLTFHTKFYKTINEGTKSEMKTKHIEIYL